MDTYLLPLNKRDVERQHTEIQYTEILILGSGIAGLFAGIHLCKKYEVTVLTKKNVAESNTEHAQGGIAVALSTEDSPKFHFGDTINAGAGLCNIEAVKILAEKGPGCVKELISIGAKFDYANNKLAFTREAAHCKNRVLHANGDATGGEIERALVEGVKVRSHITVHENTFVIDFLKNMKNEIIGALVFNGKKGKQEVWLAKAVILATGGLGQLYKNTTNPKVATGDGIAAAFRAGAELMDMEFIQFHPTGLMLSNAPRFLITEAARGEGAHLINQHGERFMENIPGKELAARDVVARAIWEQMKLGPVYLDFTCIDIDKVMNRFPRIHKTCLEYGVDITVTPLSIGPAAHYLMGGVKVNIHGETNLPNLYSCGECACNGVHGANRLASNSLLEGLVFGEAIANKLAERLSSMPDWSDVQPLVAKEKTERQRVDYSAMREKLQDIMWDKAGIIRDEVGLKEALRAIKELSDEYISELEMEKLELGNMLLLGRIVIESALERKESRGGHYRKDYPVSDMKWLKHSVQRRGDKHVSYISVSEIN